MDQKIKKIFLFIILVLLQSCSGGRFGNFIESSFKNIEEPKIKEDTKNNLNNKIDVKAEINYGKNKNIAVPKIEEDTKNDSKKQIFTKTEEKLKKKKKITKQNVPIQRKKYQPQSYKIIFILKDVDPKDPIENLSSILRDSDVNFEIEKIERFFESNNKNLKSN